MLLVVILTYFALASGVSNAHAQGQRSMPSQAYYGHFQLLYDGEYKAALSSFKDDLGGARRTTQSRWIDSICYYTMIGESHYKLGQMGDALDNYTSALTLYLSYPNWMAQVKFTDPTPATTRPAIPWGKTARNSKLGRFPSTMLISEGKPITEAAIRKGGVITAPQMLSITPQEVVRCLALAMYRRREILGPVCKHEPLTDQLTAAFGRREGPPNHWSEAWTDVMLGMASAGSGNTGQAVALLQRSLLVGGELDHPASGLALLELGRIAVESGKIAEAAVFFAEASYTAAEHGDLMVVEEAFRYGFIVHAITQPKEVMKALEPAAAWANRRGRELYASLVILAAESAALVKETGQATTLLGQAKTKIAKTDMALTELGARLAYITALTSYQRGNVAAGDEALSVAVKIQKNHSIWLYQLALTNARLSKNGITSRNAVTIFERLASDPLPIDWHLRPLDCLAVLATPHQPIFEVWYEATRDMETALEVADLARRHRFFTALPFGGRLLAIRWLLEVPPETLNNTERLQRQDILARYPAYVDLSKQAAALKTELAAMPLLSEKDNSDEARKQADLLDKLGKVSALEEILIREIAVRREPANFCFPPVRKTKDVQAMLANGQVILNIFCTGRQTHCVLIGKGKYAPWKLENSTVLDKKILAMLRAIGNYDANRELPQSQLNDVAWKAAARDAVDTLLTGSKVNFGQKFDELIIIPDGLTWYLPFEALQVGDPKQTVSLLSKTRIRYAPTMGLAMTIDTGRIESPRLAVVIGKPHPKDDPQAAEQTFDRLKAALPKTAPLRGLLPAPSPLFGALVDGLIVLEDVNNTQQAPFDWSPIPLDKIKQAGTLSSWMTLPWKNADLVVLPAFHSASENGLKDAASAGNDLFMASCGLLATGSRTVLLSRWRTGGHTSQELVRQFVQEFPFTTASDAWQRSVQLVSESPLDTAREPRIKSTPNAAPLNADHPFLWAGYMLIDRGVGPRAPEAAGAAPPVLKLEKPAVKEPAK